MKINSEEIKIRIVYDKNRGIDPKDLSDIINGLTQYYSSIPKIACINRQPNVRVVSANSGSIELGFFIGLAETGKEYFNNAADLFNCLELIDHPKLQLIKDYWNDFANTRKTLNDLYNEHPIELLIGGYFANKVWNKLKEKKIRQMTQGESRYEKQARKGIKLAVKPISNNAVKRIEMPGDKNKKELLNENSLEYVMDKKDQILPNWKNGKTVKVVGKIMSMKGLRTSTMTVSFEEEGKKYNIEILINNNQALKGYVKYFQEECDVSATVERGNMYQKPKLQLNEIHRINKQLPI